MLNTAGRKPSHPAHAHGMFEIIEEETPDIPPGSRYGNYNYTAAIAVKGLAGDNPRDVALRFTANTSQENALAPGNTYAASVRMLKGTDDDEFTAYFNPGQPYGFRTIDHFPAELANQVTMTGFGIVLGREEGTFGDAAVPMLTCTMRHTDWSSNAQNQVDFDMIYIVLKKGLLAKSFGLFQVGREMLINGVIVDWDDNKNTWVVLVTSVAVASGHQSASTALGTTPRVTSSSATRSKPLVKSSRSARRNVTSTTAVASTSATQVAREPLSSVEPTPSSTTPLDTEDGEVVESSPSFKNTFGKKRTNTDVLADARKRIKGKNSA